MMIVPVRVDITATGYTYNQESSERGSDVQLTPMVMSLDVAKNQYIKTPMKEEYNPY
jgi:hypothetical protein